MERRDIIKILNAFDEINVGNREWEVTLTDAKFNIVCWEGVTLEDLRKALKTLETAK